jgi:trigger factor
MGGRRGHRIPLAREEDRLKVAVEEVEGCKRRLAVEAPADLVQQEWERAYGRVQRQARLPGFRKGHVPRSLVKLHFADDVRREVAERLIPDVYRQAVSEAHLEPVNEPDLHVVRLEEGAPLTFVAVVEVRPEITLGDYTGIEVQHAATPVPETDVDEALDRMREQHAELRSVERAAAPGDVVIVDLTLVPEGLAPIVETGSSFQIGDGTVLPEIDQAVVGLAAGGERRVGIRFPERHQREDLRDRPGTAAVTMVEVKEKVLPDLTDDFARTLGEFETLAAVRAAIRRQLEARQAAEDRHALEEKIVDVLLERHRFGVPEALVMRTVANQVGHARDRMRRQGVDPDRVPWDYAKIAADLRAPAERMVRRALLLEAIAAREALAPGEAMVEAEIERIAQASQRPAPVVKRMMEKEGEIETLRDSLRERLTLDFLVERRYGGASTASP